MKQVYTLTKEQAEELEFIKRRIISDVDIIDDILEGELIRETTRNAIDNALRRIEAYCDNMEDILESEWNKIFIDTCGD